MNRLRARALRSLSLAGVLALLVPIGLAGSAGAQVVCEKIARPGKFKVRGACKDGRENQVVDLTALITIDEVAPRTELFHAFGSIETLGETPEFLPLDGDAETFSFETTSEGATLAISFASECSLNAVAAELQLVVFLDGVKILPRDASPATNFCASWSTDLVGHAHSVGTVVEGVAPGVHTIQVQANTTGGGGVVDDTTLMVLVNES